MTNDPPRPSRLSAFWADVLDLSLLIWVVRVPYLVLLVGLLILSAAPQAQDLVVDLAPLPWRVTIFLLLLSGWVAITIYATYLLIETDTRFVRYCKTRNSPRLEVMRKAAPYVLGVMPFVMIIIATWRSYSNLPDIADADVLNGAKWSLGKFLFTVLVLLAIFAWAFLKRPPLIARILNRCENVAQWLNSCLPGRLSFRVDTGLDTADPRPHYLGPMLLLVTLLASVTVFCFGPQTASGWLPRAMVIPALLGGWLPLLTWMAARGRRHKMPIIGGSLVALALLAALLGDSHSVRRIADERFPSELISGGSRSDRFAAMNLNQAVQLWMEENQCDEKSGRGPSSCPRPIIVAGAGGASRAGFFTASVIGHLLDHAKDQPSAAGPPLDANTVRKRLFAISGVSGSSVGAVMVVAALSRGGEETKQPCVKSRPELWHGRRDIGGWQDCLEALNSGDFLTPVLLGFIFNDRISFGWWQDRAAVLEQSWEQRFADVMSLKANVNDGALVCPGDLRCPFMSLQPKKGYWLPLLMLNGASAKTGRRIITTTLEANYVAPDCPTQAAVQSILEAKKLSGASKTYTTDAQEGKCLLFLESNLFHNLLKGSEKGGFWTTAQLLLRWEALREKLEWLVGPTPKLHDVRLSTAAHNSARFPIISPPGAIRNSSHQVIDRIVDGGYVENYGALTAMELAEAVHAVQPELAPFVLMISNDPDSDPDVRPLNTPESVLVSDLMVPIGSVMHARTGRGRLAMAQAESFLDHLTFPACGAQTSHVRVWPQFAPGTDDENSRPVSMSWWLSSPIQIHLRQQIEITERNKLSLARVWSALAKPENCLGRPVAPSALQLQ